MTKARIIADYAGTGATTDLATQAELNAVSTVASAALPKAGGTMTGDLVPATPMSNRNMIINGGMQVWQRSTSAVASGTDYHTVDRFRFALNGAMAYTSERHAMTLAELNTTGHGYAIKCLCTTADTSVASDDYAYIQQDIEAQNLQHLQYGTASAKTITLSFWVKSNKTGTYTISIRKHDATSYCIPIEYSISSADTWEKKTITITPTAGSTSLITGAGGIIANDNGHGFRLKFGLHYGTDFHGTNNTWVASGTVFGTSNQVNWVDSTSNNFYLTGIQLELGSNATPFEHRSYGDELIRCQRYYQKIGSQGSYSMSAIPIFHSVDGQASTTIFFHTTMRTQASVSLSGTAINTSGGSVAANKWACYNNSGDWNGCSSITIHTPSEGSARVEATLNNSVGSGQCSGLYGGAGCAFIASAEL